jgi:xanthine dehydrogenase accessory factor
MNKNLNWFEAVNLLKAKGEAFVLLTIISVNGSTPRNSGTKMVVSAKDCYGTIGGGHLEFKSIAFAHQFLAQGVENQHIEHFALGASLGQCCGGNCSVFFESFAASQTQIMLFGAGHVGKALTSILAELPCQLKWVDNRAEQFPSEMLVNPPANVECIVSDNPVDEIATMPASSFFIIMTHNHQLDFELCQALLKRNDFTYAGLIGSNTKWQRFQYRLKHREFAPQLIEKLTCPVGLSAVVGKRPMEVAVSIAAEIIGLYQQSTQPNSQQEKQQNTQPNSQQEKQQIKQQKQAQGLSFKDLAPLLNQSTKAQTVNHLVCGEDK